MTRDDLERANELLEEISRLKRTIEHLDSSIKRYDSNPKTRGKNRKLRFVNFFRSFKAEQEGQKSAAVFLFEEGYIGGIEISADCDLIVIINEYIKKKLSEKEAEFRSIGREK